MLYACAALPAKLANPCFVLPCDSCEAPAIASMARLRNATLVAIDLV